MPENHEGPETDAPRPRDVYADMPKPTTSVEVRERLADLLRRDLVGPHPDLDPDLAREVISEATPSTWYLTGFLAPAGDAPSAPVPEGFREEEAAEAEIENLRETETLGDSADASGREDEGAAEPPRRSFLPSSLGLTVLVNEGTERLDARVTWGDYRPEPPLREALFLPERAEELERGDITEAPPASDYTWHRIPRESRETIDLGRGSHEVALHDSGTPGRKGADALVLAVRVRPARNISLPDGETRRVRAVTVFLVNRRFRVARKYADIANAHQARLELSCESGFAPSGDLSAYYAEGFDERLADLHYRDERSFAVGHNVSADWSDEAEGTLRAWTEPLPRYSVAGMQADIPAPGVERGMEALAEAASEPTADRLRAMLADLPIQYAAWAKTQEAVVGGLPERRRLVAQTCLKNIELARRRIERGIRRLANEPTSRAAFAVMNRAVARANRQREGTLQGLSPDAVREPEWRLFQLAFILLNLDGLAEREHDDRAVVDLLFFPTGGGKTEAYLGLAAFAIARRRLTNPGRVGAGLSVVMRYTLRLLTLDQLARAAGLVCALELERQEGGSLGEWPIEIGLWVGGKATPNSFGSAKNAADGTLVKWLDKFRRDPKHSPAPLPLKDCPWCGHAFEPGDFNIYPNRTAPQRLDVTCGNIHCVFSQERLPIVAVDDEVYRRLPAFMIATVDKFANVAWEGRSGAFFGHVDRFDQTGFYGAAEPTHGAKLEFDLPPIDLVIQDELHLISGPLGTVAALYETAFDLIASRTLNGRRVGPKIVASTATVRRAEAQIAALFGRPRTQVFPPPGPSRHDSFFARTEDEAANPGRLYLGIGAPGRGPKLVFLRTLQTLLAGAEALSSGCAGDPADPYLTALCYFNALRELGGARRIVDDEVRRNLTSYGERRLREAPVGAPFRSRKLHETVELTSRESTDKVAAARKALGCAARDAEAAHVAPATNMISVGLDIGRLGLMLVQGQPKTAAEYIQATSRVGRSRGKPGLVVSLLNLHKPRDRDHYERFRGFHASFYRAVEASTVTPFAPRALDRALAGTLVTAVRHVDPDMTPRAAAERIAGHPQAQEAFAALVREKLAACGFSNTETRRALDRLSELCTTWEWIAAAQTGEGGELVYERASPPSPAPEFPETPQTAY